MSTTKRKCAVKVSKYERKDRDSVKYWQNVFKTLEARAHIPLVEKSEEVVKCIPYKLYERIAPLLGLDIKVGYSEVIKNSYDLINIFCFCLTVSHQQKKMETSLIEITQYLDMLKM